MRTYTSASTRSGQTVVLFAAVVVPVVCIMLALSSDLGSMMLTRARLQNASDAAVLAAAQVLAARRGAGDEEAEARLAATQEAEIIQQANCPEAALTVEFGSVDADGQFTALGPSEAATAVRAQATRGPGAPGGSLPLSFGPLLGVRSSQVDSAATARVTSSIRGILWGLSPFAVPESNLVPPGEEMEFYPAGDDDSPGKGKGNDKVAAGNWGLLNLDGGNHATPELRDWILYGYDGPLVIDEEGYLWIEGTPGFRCTLGQEITERIGDPMTMVIYDEVTGQGANAEYRCIGFLRATITECNLTGGPNAYAKCRVDAVCGIHGAVLGGSYSSPNLRKIELVR